MSMRRDFIRGLKIALPKDKSSLWTISEEFIKNTENYNFSECACRAYKEKRCVELPNKSKLVLDLFYSRPQDWKTLLENGFDAVVTGYNLVVNELCEEFYVKPKRLSQTPPSEVEYTIDMGKMEYKLSDAKKLKGLKYNLEFLNLGKGKLVFSSMDGVGLEKFDYERRYGSSCVDISCDMTSKAISEIWLDEEFPRRAMGYKLVPYTGSTEGTEARGFITFMNSGTTLRNNGLKPANEILKSSAVVVFKENVERGLVMDLFKGGEKNENNKLY